MADINASDESQQDKQASIGTYCHDCCNFEPPDNCRLDLLTMFKKRNAKIFQGVTKDGKQEFGIDRVCPYFNLAELPFKNVDEFLPDIKLKGTILLIADDVKQLEKTVDKLETMGVENNFNLLVIYKKMKMADLLRVCGKTKFDYKCSLRTDNDIPYAVYKSACKYGKNGYLIILECDKDFDTDIINKVNDMIYHKMFRLMHVSNPNTLHESVSMLHIYKYIKGDLGEASFSKKLDTIAEEEQTESQNFTWEFVNEQYKSKI